MDRTGAAGSPPGGGINGTLIGVGLVVVLAGAAGLIAWQRRRRDPTTTEPDP